jgi:hypothetical protein
MLFKGCQLDPGDRIQVQFKVDYMPQRLEIEAAVIKSDENALEVLSNLREPCARNIIHPEHVEKINILERGAQAVFAESLGLFAPGEAITGTIAGQTCFGRVIAALNGIVVAREKSGELLFVGANAAQKAY